MRPRRSRPTPAPLGKEPGLGSKLKLVSNTGPNQVRKETTRLPKSGPGSVHGQVPTALTSFCNIHRLAHTVTTAATTGLRKWTILGRRPEGQEVRQRPLEGKGKKWQTRGWGGGGKRRGAAPFSSAPSGSGRTPTPISARVGPPPPGRPSVTDLRGTGRRGHWPGTRTRSPRAPRFA